jgi:hypothetical protein
MNIYESIDDFNRVMKKPRKSRLDTCVMSIIKSCDVSLFNPYHIRKQTEHYCDIFVFNEMNTDIIFDSVKDCLWTCYNESKEPTLEMFHSFFDVLYNFKCGTRNWGMTHKINTLENVTFDALVDTFGNPDTINRANSEVEWNITFTHDGVSKFCRINNVKHMLGLKGVTNWVIIGSLEGYGVGEIYKHLIRKGYISSVIFS